MRKLILPIVLSAIFGLSTAPTAFSQSNRMSTMNVNAWRTSRVEFVLTKPITWQGNKLSPGIYTARFDAPTGARPIMLVLRQRPIANPNGKISEEAKIPKDEIVTTSIVDETHEGQQPGLIIDHKGRACVLMLPQIGMRLVYCSVGKHEQTEVVDVSVTYAPVPEP
jgi:hypothetical protein